MSQVRVVTAMCVRPLSGESVAGDACLVARWSKGLLMAVCDGLGHGPHAAAASAAFMDSVRGTAEGSLEVMFSSAHQALQKTRGAVAAVARFDEAGGKVSVAGLGNVTTILARRGAAPSHVVVPAGVVGSTYRVSRAQSFDFAVGDLLLMHTDGVRRFDLGKLRSLSPDQLARTLVDTHGKPTDDAACAVAAGESRSLREVEPNGAVTVPIRMDGDAECSAALAKAFVGRLGHGVKPQWEVSIAASELATNVLRYAGAGTLTLSHDAERIVVEVTDKGAGLPSAPRSRRPLGDGLGEGLLAVHRMMDRVHVDTGAGGTRVVAWKYR